MKIFSSLLPKCLPVLIAMLSFVAVAQQGTKLHLQDFTGFSHQEYKDYLARDGWPIDVLNTADNAPYLSDEEKNLIVATNLIRHNPPKYSKLYVYPRLQYFEGTLFRFPDKTPLRTREGIEAVRELYLELLETDPLPLLLPSEGLSKASADHARYMKATGYAGHEGGGGMSARITRHGKWEGGIAENLQWNSENAHEAILSLMIDDGVRSRGHRKNILNPRYLYTGVAIDKHPRLQLSYVINYAVEFVEK